MALRNIKIHQVRNLQQVSLEDLGQVNVFYGRNGSGKTSVLESIHLLGIARSFRGKSIRSLISHGQSSCTVFGELRNPRSGGAVPIGVHREAGGEAQIKIGGSPARGVAQLVEQFPLQVITTDSFDLLTGSPAGRRQFLDWGVFHVEQRFYSQWQRFQRCIKQRNMLLRRGKILDQELDVWTRDLAACGAAIGEYREAYFKQLTPRFKRIMERLAPSLGGLDLRYRQGWDRALSYRKALEQGAASDVEQGYTHIGPQRADVRVTTDGHLAAETLSRGQQKLVVCGLKLAQGQLMSEHSQGQCTYLIDDLPSELDREHSELVCSLLDSMQAQVFITCVDRQDIAEVWPEGSSLGLFHVEHGKIQPSYPAA